MSIKFPPKPKSSPLVRGVIVAVAAIGCGSPGARPVPPQAQPPDPPPQPMEGGDDEQYAEPPADDAPQVAPPVEEEEDPPPQAQPEEVEESVSVAPQVPKP